MKAFHQAASVLSQCFDRILNLTAIIQPAYLFNGFLLTVRIFQVLNQIIRMTASLPAVCSQCSSIPLRFISLTGLAALWKKPNIQLLMCQHNAALYKSGIWPPQSDSSRKSAPIDTNPDSGLVFRPLAPKLETKIYLIWKKYQVFTPIAERLLRLLESEFSSIYTAHQLNLQCNLTADRQPGTFPEASM